MRTLLLTLVSLAAAMARAHAAAPISAGTALVSGISADDARHLLAVGRAGRAFASNDSGATWTSQQLPTHEELYAVWSDPNGHAVAVGEHGAASYLDHGTWKLAATDTTETLRAVWGDDKWIVAVGGDNHGDEESGVIAWSGDAGATWSHSVVHDTMLTAVAGSDPDHVIAIGSHGAIYGTASRFSWRPIAVPFVERWGDGGRAITSALGLDTGVAIARLGTRWFVLDSGGGVFTSSDGLAWQRDDALGPDRSLFFSTTGLVARGSELVALDRWGRRARRIGAWANAPTSSHPTGAPAFAAYTATARGVIYAVGYEGGTTANPIYFSGAGCPVGATAASCPPYIDLPYVGVIARSTDGGATWTSLVR